MEKTNKKLADLIRKVWEDILDNPEEYRYQNVAEILQERIQEREQELIQQEAQKWGLKEDSLAYVVSNYNKHKDRQNGESELRSTADYDYYKQSNENPLPKLRYWSKGVKPSLQELYEKEIEPLENK